MTQPSGPISPLDPYTIGANLRNLLEQQEPENFPPAKFPGAGLYALYYVGNEINEYLPLVECYHHGHKVPVYVGKAAAGNSNYGYNPDYNVKRLHQRITEHANSVGEVARSSEGNLRREDFEVRYLPLEDAWITLGERALLRAYRPVLWNTIVSGFGSNAPGIARTNPRSVWDTMHPGRKRAGNFPNRRLTLDEMHTRIQRGVEISLMQEGEERDRALDIFIRSKPSVIWASAKERDPDRRIRVSDERRFLEEIERIGVDRPEYRLVSTNEIKLSTED